MCISYAIGSRYRWPHYAGVVLVLLGIGVKMIPSLQGGDSGGNATGIAYFGWACMMVVSTISAATSNGWSCPFDADITPHDDSRPSSPNRIHKPPSPLVSHALYQSCCMCQFGCLCQVFYVVRGHQALIQYVRLFAVYKEYSMKAVQLDSFYLTFWVGVWQIGFACITSA